MLQTNPGINQRKPNTEPNLAVRKFGGNRLKYHPLKPVKKNSPLFIYKNRPIVFFFFLISQLCSDPRCFSECVCLCVICVLILFGFCSFCQVFFQFFGPLESLLNPYFVDSPPLHLGALHWWCGHLRSCPASADAAEAIYRAKNGPIEPKML